MCQWLLKLQLVLPSQTLHTWRYCSTLWPITKLNSLVTTTAILAVFLVSVLQFSNGALFSFSLFPLFCCCSVSLFRMWSAIGSFLHFLKNVCVGHISHVTSAQVTATLAVLVASTRSLWMMTDGHTLLRDWYCTCWCCRLSRMHWWRKGIGCSQSCKNFPFCSHILAMQISFFVQ